MLAERINSALISRSFAQNLTNSSCDMNAGTAPTDCRRARISGDFEISVILALSFAVISLRCPGRRPDAIPDRHIGSLHARFGQCRNVWELSEAFGVADAEQDQLAGFDMCQCRRFVHQLYGVGEQIVERIGSATIGHMQDIESGLGFEHFEAQMRRRARP